MAKENFYKVVNQYKERLEVRTWLHHSLRNLHINQLELMHPLSWLEKILLPSCSRLGRQKVLFTLIQGLSEEVARKPYPANYMPLIFPKYDGVARNAKEHIRRYVDSLMAHSHDHELRLREFFESLEGCACTWYTSLSLGSVVSWNDMASQFMKKFFTLD